MNNIHLLIPSILLTSLSFAEDKQPEKKLKIEPTFFQKMDENSDGIITSKEVQKVAKKEFPAEKFHPLPEIIITIFDTNDDGILDQTEQENAFVQLDKMRRQLKAFSYWDRNQNGTYDAHESEEDREEHHQHIQQRTENFLKNFDLNEDGKVSLSEFAEAGFKSSRHDPFSRKVQVIPNAAGHPPAPGNPNRIFFPKKPRR